MSRSVMFVLALIATPFVAGPASVTQQVTLVSRSGLPDGFSCAGALRAGTSHQLGVTQR